MNFLRVAQYGLKKIGLKTGIDYLGLRGVYWITIPKK